MFRFDQPGNLWLLLLAVPMLWLGWRSLTTLEPGRRWTAIGIRLAGLVLLVMILSGLELVQRHAELTVVAVVDQSESVQRFFNPPMQGTTSEPVSVQRWAQQFLQQAQAERRPDDRLGLITFDGRPAVRTLPSIHPLEDQGAAQNPLDGTDTAAALRLAMAMFPADSSRRIVLFWDGNDTVNDQVGGQGNVMSAVNEARAAGIPIDVVPLDYRLDREVMVESVISPTEARRGQTVALRVVLSATQPAEGMLFLRMDGEPIDLAPGQAGMGAEIGRRDWTRQTETTVINSGDATDTTVTTAPMSTGVAGRYLCVRLIEVPMQDRGLARFEAVFESSEGSDAIAANNRAESFTLVHGQGRVLLVDNVGGESGDILSKALVSRGIENQRIVPEAFPTDLVTLLRYDAVVLQNVPADAITLAQNRMLARYVNDLGGGLVMVGGPESFGAGGWTNSPVDRVLPVECQIPAQTVLPSGALVIVTDRSGSMAGMQGGAVKLEIANEAAVQAVMTMYPQDLVGVVAFDTQTTWVIGRPGQLELNQNPAAIARRIRSIQPGGGTDIYPGLEQAYSALARLGPEDAAVKHIILLTDGQSNDGPWFEIMGKMARAGITLSTVGVGDDVNGQLLTQLAQMGGGNFYQVQDPRRLPQIFVKEARTIRRNLVKEEPFVPTLVQTGSPVTAGLGGTPQLRGLVLTGPKLDPRVFMPMVGPEGEPVFAHWQVGLGRSAAFTSDATNRWAVDWLGWDGFADFWARTIRQVARPSSSRQFDLTTTIERERLRIRLDATAAQGGGNEGGARTGPGAGPGGFANFMEVVGTVIGPGGEPTGVRLAQTGPGVYEATLPVQQAGNYIVNLVAKGRGKEDAQVIFGGVTLARGRELRTFNANRAAVEQVAAMTGGRVLDAASSEAMNLFDRQTVVESRSLRSLWRPLVMALMALFLVDVAVRRIAWDLPAMGRWVVRRVDAVLGLLRPRQVQSETTLEALKARAQKVETQLSGAAGGAAGASVAMNSGGDPAKVKANRERKFDAAEDEGAAEDFAAAIGGAGVSENASVDVHALSEKKKTGDEAATTSRLLDAKRRARERHEKGEG